MRIILLAMAATALAGCTFQSTTVRRAAAPAPTVVYAQPAPTVVYGTPVAVYPTTNTAYAAPTVAYTVSGQAAFDRAAYRAADWCRDHYGERARLYDTRQGSAGDIVTFECVRG